MPTSKNKNKLTKKSNKNLILIIVVLAMLISWSFSYFYVKNTSENSTEVKNINTSFNLKWDIKVIEKWVRTGFWDFSLLGWKMMVFENWLKQKLSFWELVWKSEFNNEKLDFEMKNLDIISDNQKVFISLDKWVEKLSEILAYTKYSWLTEELNKNLGKWNYIMIDNSKAILKVLWELSKNKLIKELVIWVSTSNPSQYYLEHWVNEKLDEFLSNDKILDYLFLEWEKNESTDKVRLSLNTTICNDFWPVIVNLWNNLQWSIPLNMDEVSSDDIIKECTTWIKDINNIMWFLVQIYKEWDIDNWNFAFSITAWNILDIKLNYLNHIIDNWYLSLEAPDKSLSLNIKSDKKEGNASNLKIDYKNSWFKVVWEIVNWKWNIHFLGKEEWVYELLWDINISAYFISDYDITWKLKVGEWVESSFEAKWDFVEWWNINYLINEYWRFYKLNLDYSVVNKSYNIEYNDDSIAFISSYKDEVLSVQWHEKDSNWNKKWELDITIDNWKIKWFIKDDQNIDMVIIWDFTSLKGISLVIDEKIEDFKVEFKSKLKSLSELEFSLQFSEQWKELSKSILTIKVSKEDWFNVVHFNIDISWSDDFSVDANLKIEAKHWWVEYKVPENYKEININVSELLILPNTINSEELYADKKLII